MDTVQITTSKYNLGKIILMILLCLPVITFAQETKEQKKDLKAAKNYLSEAQKSLQDDKFSSAEADYRKAISLNPKSETAKYNLGTAYYGKEKNAEAMLRFKQAATLAKTKEEKHRAFHNLGNTFMNEEKYQEAVEAYKNALRNNPKDEETRYNLALAKDMLDKNPPPPEDNDDDQDKNEDQQDQDNQDQNQDNQDDQGDKGDDKEDGDKGDDKKDEGDQNEDQGQPDEPKDEEGDQPEQQQPVPGKLSPEQVKSLLEAMNNEEKKVQEKMNAEKQKGVKVKSDKDW